jgi:hypothetical protein
MSEISDERLAELANSYMEHSALGCALRELQRRRAVEGWQPIESAPRDDAVLMRCQNGDRVNYDVAQNESRGDGHVWVDARYHEMESHGWRATHWQPLPPTPSAPKQERCGRWLCSQHTEPTKNCEECYSFWRNLMEGVSAIRKQKADCAAKTDEAGELIVALREAMRELHSNGHTIIKTDNGLDAEQTAYGYQLMEWAGLISQHIAYLQRHAPASEALKAATELRSVILRLNRSQIGIQHAAGCSAIFGMDRDCHCGAIEARTAIDKALGGE